MRFSAIQLLSLLLPSLPSPSPLLRVASFAIAIPTLKMDLHAILHPLIDLIVPISACLVALVEASDTALPKICSPPRRSSVPHHCPSGPLLSSPLVLLLVNRSPRRALIVQTTIVIHPVHARVVL